MMSTDPQRLADVLIVSQVAVDATQAPDDQKELRVSVSKADGAKCERCWKYDIHVGADANHPTVCPRCAAVLTGASA